MSIWWSLQLRREAESVPLARRLLRGAMDTAGVDPDISYDLSVALSEACANAVEHGGPTTSGAVRPATRSYRVTAYLDGEMCRIEVTDSGPGFPQPGGRTPPSAPAPVDAEHGRGLCLIEEIADHVSFGNRPGTGGAVVSFDKILKWREDALLQPV
ncbi:ATP-binding protein [Streptomyces triticagri]|uniref:ATP-binding protein n=1 Tax=Streptomyces triticagri TaxID=2293568 RepID=A0A372LXD8_9ACTN|nr:ATP-binding protein [Streptomyces triticagri]RFU83209.1 ATP-binding protein [Streptomyces triticagri]